MKGHWAFDDCEAFGERDVHQVRVKLQVDGRIQPWQQLQKRFATAQLVGRADVGDRSQAEMLRLEQFADKHISIVQEGGELRVPLSERFNGARAVDDVAMWDVGDQLFEIESAERPIALAQRDQFGVVISGRFGQTAPHAPSITLRLFVQRDRSRGLRPLESGVDAVVADDDHPLHQGMG